MLPTLDLADLAKGSSGITPEWGAGLAQAASVCLDAQGHSSPQSLDVSGPVTQQYALYWLPVDAQMRRCFNDLEDAGEHGAYGIAALLVADITPLEVVERSKKGTGFDYWLGPKGTVGDLFQRASRLEVSHIMKADPPAVSARVKKKLKQTEPSDDTGLSAYVVVVEYGTPLARVAEK